MALYNRDWAHSYYRKFVMQFEDRLLFELVHKKEQEEVRERWESSEADRFNHEIMYGHMAHRSNAKSRKQLLLKEMMSGHYSSMQRRWT